MLFRVVQTFAKDFEFIKCVMRKLCNASVRPKGGISPLPTLQPPPQIFLII